MVEEWLYSIIGFCLICHISFCTTYCLCRVWLQCSSAIFKQAMFQFNLQRCGLCGKLQIMAWTSAWERACVTWKQKQSASVWTSARTQKKHVYEKLLRSCKKNIFLWYIEIIFNLLHHLSFRSCRATFPSWNNVLLYPQRLRKLFLRDVSFCS